MSSREKKMSLAPHRKISHVLIYWEVRGFVSYFQKLMKQMLRVFRPFPLRPLFHFLFPLCFHSQQPASVLLWKIAFICSQKNNHSTWGKTLVGTEFTQFIVLIIPSPPSHWRPQTLLIPTGIPLCTLALQLPAGRGVCFSTPWNCTWCDLLWPRRYKQKWYKERLRKYSLGLSLPSCPGESYEHNQVTEPRFACWMMVTRGPITSTHYPQPAHHQTCAGSHWEPHILSPANTLISSPHWDQPNLPNAPSVLMFLKSLLY